MLTRTSLLQVLRYCLVGLLNTAVGYSVFAFLVYVILMSESAANVISYAIGIVNSFFWNKLWTFRSRGDTRREFAVFLAVAGLSFALQFAVFSFLLEAAGLEKSIAYFGGMCVYTAAGFLGNKFFAFNLTKN